jgi:gamma-glutamylcyclotransferase (GGCT)/AIG2-like uncharacterized protein YtfP
MDSTDFTFIKDDCQVLYALIELGIGYPPVFKGNITLKGTIIYIKTTTFFIFRGFIPTN